MFIRLFRLGKVYWHIFDSLIHWFFFLSSHSAIEPIHWDVLPQPPLVTIFFRSMISFCFFFIFSIPLTRFSTFSPVSWLFIIAHWSILMITTLKCLSGNYSFSVISMLVSLDCTLYKLFICKREIIWKRDFFIVMWLLWVLRCETLDSI